MELLGYVVLAFATATAGAAGGIGGAVLLVPALVFLDVPASEAAPLGLVSVAAGSIAAGPRQLLERSVNHRIGVATELVASTGAVAGAMASGAVSDRALTTFLAIVAAGAALAGVRRSGVRNPPFTECEPSDVGERVGSLAGAYPLGDGIAPYEATRLPTGLSFMALAGLVAGLVGTSGGFIKTPATSEIMRVPVKVAASTTTFTVGITASAALVVFAVQGRIDPELSSAVILGALAGGRVGAAVQSRLSPSSLRRATSLVLIAVAAVLVVRA